MRGLRDNSASSTAGPSGARLPCSQLRRVPGETPICCENATCERPVLRRTAETSTARGICSLRPGTFSPRACAAAFTQPLHDPVSCFAHMLLRRQYRSRVPERPSPWLTNRIGCIPYHSLINKAVVRHDPTLDILLDLDGQQFTIEPSGYTVKFNARKVPATPLRPHGISYSLTLHAPDGARLVGFDNAHAVRASRGPAGPRKGADHRHRLGTTRPYRYIDALQLLEDFWSEVNAVLDELGITR